MATPNLSSLRISARHSLGTKRTAAEVNGTSPSSPHTSPVVSSVVHSQDWETVRDKLDTYYGNVKEIILNRQHPCSGLVPASTAVTVHGDYRDAWVRDNVYSVYIVFALALAYRRGDDDRGIAYELEHACVKLMRGLLFAMMRQSSKVEQFKYSQSSSHALHAKYRTSNGDTVVGDGDWGHLQVDATSLFILALAQMTAAGLLVVFTQDEVDFIQNLVYYIERCYRIADYGIWERGNKINQGTAELNTSSIGMVVGSLRAINGLNLFGTRGGPSSVIHALPDEMARNEATLHSCLPRESASKEVDAALLSVIGFPAFACNDISLTERTRNEIISKLGGIYGCKRFLRDGHQTAVEDTRRLHYLPAELQVFENIESEWPLFFTYLILDAQFRHDQAVAEHFRSLLEPLLVLDESTGRKLVPELYRVPKDKIELEKANPHSQTREPNENVPLVWAQSLYLLGNLIHDGLLSVAEIDPIGLHRLSMRPQNDTLVQIVLLSESVELQTKLSTYGIATQTLEEVAPFHVAAPSVLRDAYMALGRNSKLGLTGRPPRPIGSLGTCKIYSIRGTLCVFLPQFMDANEFYLTIDNPLLVSMFEHELAFIKKYWKSPGRPTMCVLLNASMLMSSPRNKSSLLSFMMQLRSGHCNNVRVRLSRLQEVLPTACVTSLDFLAENMSSSHLSALLNPKSLIPTPRIAVLRPEILTTRSRRRITSQKMSINFKSPLASPVVVDSTTPPSATETNQQQQKQLQVNTLEDNAAFKLRAPDVNSPRLRSMSPSTLNSHENTNSAESISRSKTQTRSSPASSATRRGRSKGNLNMLMMGNVMLSLGDESGVSRAIQMLEQSVNLYEQVDLLHYLHSCKGLNFSIEKMGTVGALLEEVYVKAAHLGLWSIVRQSAGLLHKVVNSLSGNLSDLLARQHHVSIGYATKEKYISSPVSPEALTEIIYSSCNVDIREAALIQELLTYLGSLIRGHPELFEGILRIRLHYMIIAMREWISRNKGLTEEDSYEQLMQLAPHGIKELLTNVLTAQDLTGQSSHHTAESPLSPSHPIGSISSPTVNEESSKILLHDDVMELTVRSAGFHDGNFCSIEIAHVGHIAGDRGINMVVLDAMDGSVVQRVSLDTHLHDEESQELVRCIQFIEDNEVFILAVCDDAARHLSHEARSAIASLGSRHIQQLDFRDAWCMIGRKGFDNGSVLAESLQKTGHGPIQLGPIRVPLSRSRLPRFHGPHRGRWLHRRRNDGAIGRVPPLFYPRVWHILDQCHGLVLANNLLPRDPTVLEKTPEEFNFALQVESVLDAYVDPIERQMAVETLVAIAKIQERNPEMNLRHETIFVDKIVQSAAQLHWETLSQPVRTQILVLNSTVSLAETANLSFEANQDMARRFFFDLSQDTFDGIQGTLAYLARAALLVIPYQIDSSSTSCAIS